MEYLATFYTHSGAVKLKKMLDNENIQAVMMPVPRKLSSSCGVCIKFSYSGDLRNIIIDDIDSIYVVENNGDYRLIYSESRE